MNEKCYRFTATPSLVQSYATLMPNGKECEYFWPNNLTELKAVAPIERRRTRKTREIRHQ